MAAIRQWLQTLPKIIKWSTWFRHRSEKDKINIPLEDIVAHLPGHVYWLDKNNVFLGCNDSQAISAGLKNRKEIIGKTNYDMPWRDHADALNKVNNQVMTTGQEQSVEEIGTQADGTECIFLSKKTPLLDKKRNIVGILGVSLNITKQKELESRLMESNEKTSIALENIIANLPGNVYWLDQNNVYLGCNTIQARSAGLKDSQEVVGKTNHDMPWRDQADNYNAINNQVMTAGQEHSIEEVAKHADGEERIFISKKVPLLDNKKNIIGTLGISFDITKQKEFEKNLIEAKNQAEAANNAKTTFLNNMRHDLRTPLTGIIGAAEIIKKGENNPNKIEEYSNILIRSSQALLGFLNNVLDSIELDSGKIPLLEVKFELEPIIRKVIDLNTAKAFEKQLQFKFEHDSNIPKYLIGDSKRIYRITLELVTNALKYTRVGGIFVSTKLVEINNDNVIIKISIKDTGMGIPADKKQEIFTRFKRLNPSFQGVYNGSGLGLSLVKQFIEDLGAEIYVESELEKGSTFTCVFLVKKALVLEEFGVAFDPEFINFSQSSKIGLEARVLTQLGNSSTLPKNTSSPKRILLVEDHEMTAKVAKEVLSSASYPVQVDVASDGATAIYLTSQYIYDIVFMDHGLPDMDGCTATAKMRVNSKNKTVPIIGLTAYASNQTKQRYLEAGMNTVLAKPLMQNQVQGILDTFIRETCV